MARTIGTCLHVCQRVRTGCRMSRARTKACVGWWRLGLTSGLAATPRAGAEDADQPSYSKPILRSTRYSTIWLSSTIAVDFTTSTVLMLRTVLEAVATA